METYLTVKLMRLDLAYKQAHFDGLRLQPKPKPIVFFIPQNSQMLFHKVHGCCNRVRKIETLRKKQPRTIIQSYRHCLSTHIRSSLYAMIFCLPIYYRSALIIKFVQTELNLTQSPSLYPSCFTWASSQFTHRSKHVVSHTCE